MERYGKGDSLSNLPDFRKIPAENLNFGEKWGRFIRFSLRGAVSLKPDDERLGSVQAAENTLLREAHLITSSAR